jgi:DNA-binding transcriptional LysR family regulator
MNDALDWEDLRLFYKVASLGSLAAASSHTGISSPTIGRRMHDLERVLQRELFIRRQTGYALAPDGRQLFDRVLMMRDGAQSVEDWRLEAVPLPGVDISLDHWMANFVSANLASLWTPDDPFQMCIEGNGGLADIWHRRVAITVSDKRPQSGNVAIRSAPTVKYAVYCAKGFDASTKEHWVSIGRGELDAPWANWASSKPGIWITAWTYSPSILLDIVRSGAGRTVLPCYIGDADPKLIRLGDTINDLTHDSWIVIHDDERKRPEIRMFVDRLVELFARNADLFAGDRPVIPSTSR